MTSELQLKNKRVLIVDDLVEARSAMKSMMAMLGAENVETARDGREATDMITERDYDLVLSDYNLGKGKDGQQVLEEARHTNRLKATSLFVIVTGENAVDKVMGALEYEPDGYITKPYTLSILRERLQRLMAIKEVMKPVNQALDLGDVEWAISMAHHILHDNPGYLLPVSRILGKLHLQRQEFAEAHSAYNAVLEQRPAIWARLGQAVCTYHMGDPDHAVTLLREILLDHPLYVQCHDWLARIMLEKEKNIEAQQELQSAVAISPRGVLRQIESQHQFPESQVRQNYDLIQSVTDGDNLPQIVDNILAIESDNKWLSKAVATLKSGCPTTMSASRSEIGVFQPKIR